MYHFGASYSSRSSRANVGKLGQRTLRPDSAVFEFRDLVLNWGVHSILSTSNPPENYCCVPRVPVYSNASQYYSTLQPLIIAESWAQLRESLGPIMKDKTKKWSRLRIIRARQPYGEPARLDVNGRIWKYDSKFEMVLIKSGPTDLAYLGHLTSKDPSNSSCNLFTLRCNGSISVDVDDTLFVIQLCSLVTLNRAFVVCAKRPAIPFFENLGGASATLTERYIARFGNDVEDSLNSAQRDAVSSFRNIETGLQLLQGPPGTGKTTTIVSLLQHLVEAGEVIMVCAPSNKAVQVIAKRFVTKNPTLPVIFAGREEKLDPELRPIFLDKWKSDMLREIRTLTKTIIDTIELLELQKDSASSATSLAPLLEQVIGLYTGVVKIIVNLSRFSFENQLRLPLVTTGNLEELLGKLKLKAIVVKLALEELRRLEVSINRLLLELDRVDIENILLRHSRVIFCTLSFAGQQRMENIRATALIVDEAAQATEAETLIPFSLRPRKCLLVGDVNQLPAVVTSEVAKVNHYDWSMMHRLQNEAKFPFQLLNVQYRMDPQIRAWPSQQFYDDALQDAPEISRRPRINLPPQLAPYSFLQVRCKELTAYSSKRNKEESAIVVQCVQYLTKRRICTTDELGIITFYSGQVEQINADLSKAKIVEPRAQTVDGFQGEEKDIIIISFVRSNREKGVGFLSDFRRLNVALTRAKRALIMIGDSSTLSQDETLASMLQHIVQHKNLFKSSVVMANVFQSKSRDSAMLMEEMSRQLFSVSVSRPAGHEEQEEAELE